MRLFFYADPADIIDARHSLIGELDQTLEDVNLCEAVEDLDDLISLADQGVLINKEEVVEFIEEFNNVIYL